MRRVPETLKEAMHVMFGLENARKGMGSVLPAVALMSPMFWIAWIELIYSGDIYLSAAQPTSLQIILAYVASTTAMALMLIVYGCFPRKVEPWLQNRWVVIGAGAAAGLATLLSLLTGSFVATVATGVFTSVLAARFGLLFSQVGPKAALFSIIVAQILASFVYGYVLALPAAWKPPLLCLLPFMSAFCSLLDGGKLHYEVPGPMQGVTRGFLRFVVAIALFSIAINIVRGFYPSTIEMDTFAEARGNSSVLFFFVKMGLACVVLFLPTKTNLGKLCYFGFVALAFLTLPLPLFGLGSSFTLETFGCVNALLNVVTWSLFAGIAYKSGRSPVRLFGWGWGGMSLGSVVGWLIGFGLYAAGVGGSMMTAIEVVLLGVMLISCVLVVTWQVVDGLFDPIDEDASDEVADRSIAGREDMADSGAGGEPGAGGSGDAPGSGGAPGASGAGDVPGVGASADGAPDAKSAGEAAGSTNWENGVTAGATMADDAESRPRRAGRWRRAALSMAADRGLSSRESEVFELLLKGYTKQRIAEELFIAYNTVRSHVRNIYSKCDAHSQQDLINLFETEYLS